MDIPDMYLEELIGICISKNWEDMYPCELPEFQHLTFPDSQERCHGNCVNCLLVASGNEQIYTP